MADLDTRTIKLFAPTVTPAMVVAACDVLSSGCLTQGPKVEQFESAFSDKFKVAYPVSVNSGTAALETLYDLLELGPGDEVISTPLTCTATNLPLIKRGVKIVWADVLTSTLCIDPRDVEKKLTRRTKAIVQVHLGGIQANAHEVAEDIPVISDAAQALGIFVGDYTACSFQAIKHITTGDGGMAVVPSFSEAQDAKLWRWFGIDRNRPTTEGWQAYKTRMQTAEPQLLGGKRHMNDLAAALGIAGLANYDAQLEHRKSLFQRYRERLQGLADLSLVDGYPNTYWLCTVLVERRDAFAKMLWEQGIQAELVQVRNDAYAKFGGRAKLPKLDLVESRYISLPIGPHVSLNDVEYICYHIRGGW